MTNEILTWIKYLIATNQVIRFYKSTIWQKKKKEIWIRDNYECQECKKEGLVTLKQHTKLDIHHIKELKQYPELALDNNNLKTVCVRHHNILDNKCIKKEKEYDNEERW
jgi:5-methylcytosine-specific restriction endonuclease McrA